MATRIYETSAGLLHVTFAPDSVLLTKVPPEGWFPRFGRGAQVARSPSPTRLVGALSQDGLPAADAARIADQMLADWGQIEIPEERTRRQQLVDVLRIAILFLGLLARTPRFIWEVIRNRSDTGEAQEDFVRPGSSEYGVTRLVRTSQGWAEFEFWGGPQISLGVHRADGWLPLTGHRHYLGRAEVIEALRTHGLPQQEAEDLYDLVFSERLARVAPSLD